MNKESSKIIVFSGTGGVGKTYASAEYFLEMKRKYPDKNIGYISEIARKCPYPICKKTTFESQLWIFTAQLKAELEALQQYDMVISDTGCLDNLAYMGRIEKNLHYLYFSAFEHINRNYEKIFFIKMANAKGICTEDGRETDYQFRADIEKKIEFLYLDKNLKIKPIIWEANHAKTE